MHRFLRGGGGGGGGVPPPWICEFFSVALPPSPHHVQFRTTFLLAFGQNMAGLVVGPWIREWGKFCSSIRAQTVRNGAPPEPQSDHRRVPAGVLEPKHIPPIDGLV